MSPTPVSLTPPGSQPDQIVLDTYGHRAVVAPAGLAVPGRPFGIRGVVRITNALGSLSRGDETGTGAGSGALEAQPNSAGSRAAMIRYCFITQSPFYNPSLASTVKK